MAEARVTAEHVEAVVTQDKGGRVTAEHVEAVVEQLKGGRVTAEHVEAVVQQVTGVRTSAEFIEVLVLGAQGVRTSAELVEVLILGAQGVRTSAEYVEVLLGPTPQDVANSGIVSGETFGGNLVQWNDETFEIDQGYWVNEWSAFPSVTTDQASHGTHALEWLLGSSTTSRVRLPYAARVVGGRSYTAMARFRPATTARTVNVRFVWFDSGGFEIGTSTPGTGVEQLDQWTEIVVTATAPTGAVSCGLSLEVVVA